MNDGNIDLSGHWTGFYNYPDGGSPVPFEAVLEDRSGIVTGTTTELSEMPAGFKSGLHAVIDGQRTGNTVRFLKMYDDPDGVYDVVRYDGTIDGEGNEIAGQWTIPGVWSGTFLMVRAPGEEETQEEKIAEKIDAPR